MKIAKVASAQVQFTSAEIIDIEVDLSRGLHAFSIVGMAHKSVEEAKDRVAAAIKNSGYISPKSRNQKVVISLAPAHTRKEGSGFDLGMAVGYLLATGDIVYDPQNKLFVGELSLDGKVREIKGVLPITQKAKEVDIEEVFVPKGNAAEAAFIKNISGDLMNQKNFLLQL